MILRSTRARCHVASTELRKGEFASVDSTLATFQRLFDHLTEVSGLPNGPNELLHDEFVVEMIVMSSSSIFVPTAWDQNLETVHASPDAPTHNLKKVFNAIPADVRQKLEDAYKK